MSLRIKLLLAFLAFSVIPLSAVVFYSYTTSTRAFRKVMEAEAMAMTEEMERELGKVKQELHNQLNQFCELPFNEIKGQPSIRKESRQNPDWQKFIKTMPANEYVLEALEFIPQPPPPPATPHLIPPGRPNSQPELNAPMADDKSDRFIIYMEKGSESSAVSLPSTTSHLPAGTQGPVESTPPKPPAPPSPVNETDSNNLPAGIEQQIFHAAEQVRAANEMARQQEKYWKHKAGYYRQLSEQQKKDIDEKKHMMHLLLGRGFTSEVRDSGKVVGTVSAQVDSQKILDRILSGHIIPLMKSLLPSMRKERFIPLMPLTSKNSERFLWRKRALQGASRKSLPGHEELGRDNPAGSLIRFEHWHRPPHP